MRATRAIIHLDNLRHNIRSIAGRLRSAGGAPVPFIVAVKADGYGHGAGRVASVAREEGAEGVGVATVEEGAHLRDVGFPGRILLYSIALAEEAAAIVELGLEPFVADRHYVRALAEAAEGSAAPRALPVHLKIDTGMGRIGCRPEEAAELAAEISGERWLNLAGVCTHFPAADSDDQSFTYQQLERFQQAVETIRSRGVDPGCLHAANSGACLEVDDASLDSARPGISVYGYYPSHDQRRAVELKPVMELESRVVFVKSVDEGETVSYGRTWTASRRTRIATIPAGYADGYNRLLSNRAEVLLFTGEVAGASESAMNRSESRTARRVPVVGRICMDQFMIDCGPDSNVRVGDRVVLFGPDPRGPDAEELADLVGTIPYEVVSQINHRVPRVYHSGR